MEDSFRDQNLSRPFHYSSKNHLKGHPPIHADRSLWPKEWRTIFYKTYPRFRKIKLHDKIRRADLFDVILNRRSRNDFSNRPITTEELSTLLKYSCGITDIENNLRAQPSAGARFPIEIYPILFTGKELSPGVYHYNVKDHALSVLWERSFSSDEIESIFLNESVHNVSAVFIFTTNFSRNQMKYGERGYRYILLEAGHIAQNLYLTAEALGIRCCSLGSVKDTALESLLDIDGITESVVYALVLG